MMKFIESNDASDYEILGPNGFEPLVQTFKTIKFKVYRVTLENGVVVECADEHIFINSDGVEVFASYLREGDLLSTQDGPHSKVISIEETTREENMYDVEMASGHLYFSNGVLSHNTTTSAAYILHQVVFNSHYQIGILANKNDTAKEILDRVKMMYEYLPKFMQVGVTVWNKNSIDLGNGSKVLSAATSSSSIRGRSLNCVSGDTKVTIMSEAGDVQVTTMEDLYTQPTTPKFDIGEVNKSCKTRVLSQDKLFRSFDGMKREKVNDTIEIHFDDESSLRVTPEHEIFLDGEYVEARHLKVGDRVHSTQGRKRVVRRVSREAPLYVYDFVNVEETNNYFANDTLIHQCIFLDEFAHIQNDVEFFTSTFPVISSGKTTKVIMASTPNGMNLFYKLWYDAQNNKNSFAPLKFPWSVHPQRDQRWKEEMIAIQGEEQFNQEHEGEFIGSAGTLISSNNLQHLSFDEPIEVMYDRKVKIYERPQPEHQYVATIDVSEGVGKDFSVINIIDISKSPFEQVAVFRDNHTTPISLTEYAYELMIAYNNAYCVVESNSIGKIVADNLHFEYEYEDIIWTKTKDGNINSSSSGAARIGLYQSKRSKKIGCSNLKSLIEGKMLRVRDYETIQELYSFIKKGDSYEAEKGKTDDICMTLVLFAWLTDQTVFEELSQDGIKRKLMKQYLDSQEESNISFGYLVDGSGDSYEDDEFAKVVNQANRMFLEHPRNSIELNI